MSIQDESFPSFPYDDLDVSRNSGKHMVFPHHKPRPSKFITDQTNLQNNLIVSDVSTTLSTSNQDDSTQSSNDCPLESETSGKTNASEEIEKKKSEYKCNNQNKAVSYQDIHSEYTKRRYKHVESKVGQYIANIKAQDKKRRSSGKFQRHSSMPETLSGQRSGQSETELHNTPTKHGIMRHSTNDLDSMHESDHDTDHFDNYTTTTASSSRELGQDAGIFVDKHTYEQWLRDKERFDYLQSKLEEKNAENWRLKQNLDTMRIEYTLCKDKLKQVNQTQRLSSSFGMSAVSNLGRSSLQCLLNPKEITKEKCTQTDIGLTPSPVPPLGNGMFATPLTPDSNNNSADHAAMGVLAPGPIKVSKTIATIQPLSLNFSNLVDQDNSRDYSSNNTMGFLRQRSNSMAAHKKSIALATNTSKTSSAGSSVPSGDSAIDIEVIDSPRKQRQSRREEFVYFEKRSQRHGYHEVCNSSRNCTETEITDSTDFVVSTTDMNDKRINRKYPKKSGQRQSLRSRMLRFFGACTKCDDPNITLDTLDHTQQSTSSQFPLLEKSLTIPRDNSTH